MIRPRIALAGCTPQLNSLHWESDNRLRIGSGPDADVRLTDPSIRRRHAVIDFTERGWVVRDLGSRAGTHLNEQRLTVEPRPLELGDVLHMGRQALRVMLLEPDGQPELAIGPGRVVKLQAVMQRSWKEALQELDNPVMQRFERRNHLLARLRVGHHLIHLASLEELLQATLADVVAILDAQRGAIALADPATGELRVRAVAKAEHPSRSGSPLSQTIAQRCFSQEESLLCGDAQAADDQRGNIASLICAVLRSPRRRLGVLQLDRGPAEEPFTLEDLSLADALAGSVSTGIEGAALLESLVSPTPQHGR